MLPTDILLMTARGSIATPNQISLTGLDSEKSYYYAIVLINFLLRSHADLQDRYLERGEICTYQNRAPQGLIIVQTPQKGERMQSGFQKNCPISATHSHVCSKQSG